VQGSIDWAEVEQFIAKKLADGHDPKRVDGLKRRPHSVHSFTMRPCARGTTVIR
jgi:hypothetical protein